MAYVFGPGDHKTARVPVTVQPAGLNCSVKLFLGVNESNEAASATVNFVSTGGAQTITLPVTMPTAYGQYHVYIDLMAESFLLVGFVATEDVIIPGGTVGPPVWS
jgi:hypothetical protein